MDKWNPAKIWQGCEHQVCSYCKHYIKRGEWTKQNATTGAIMHDDEAELVGAYNGIQV